MLKLSLVITGVYGLNLLCSTCTQGWVAFQSSCYQMGKESKPWKVAQQTCETSSQGAHLLDIGSEEEHGFVLSYLQKISRIIMLWTGLNDLKVMKTYFVLSVEDWNKTNGFCF
uniref:C-type lectin domain-containing protein n=1 Tax=Taeniopygia guttata TaxID=59729 RepID=A0A674HVK0_TAEGU